ncbi:cysteine-rich DPF motif domain-containing protein 1-like [Oscarella lobularis]|uniref:cysteine-rich DPF motif domain-containing protein 1-like n=1 Tax=Oscarella lobularis TaxID=121494 RepID=UPI0033139C84
MSRLRNVFRCSRCGLAVHFDYFGQKPPFNKAIVLLEEAYILKDPFAPDDQHLTLGGHCSLCKDPVCVGQLCSLFYTKRFCLSCVKARIDEFPDEIKKEVEGKDIDAIQKFD